MTGRDCADGIALDSLAGARGAATAASFAASRDAAVAFDVPTRSRIERVEEVLALVSGRAAPHPRDIGLPVFELIRYAVAVLTAGLPDGGARTRMGVVLDEVDAAVTALGGRPLLIDDPDDWSLEEDVDAFVAPSLSTTAATVSMIARDCVSALASDPSPRTAMMRRDAFRLFASCLSLRIALSSRDGAPLALVGPVAEIASESVDRVRGMIDSWRRVGDGKPTSALLDTVDSLADFAAEVVEEIRQEAPAPAP